MPPFGATNGLSPRGRGNLLVHPGKPAGEGSIPAWAGEPRPGAAAAAPQAVYPRVGGGTPSVAVDLVTGYGLSPRGRGNHDVLYPSSGVRRSIPAWAGEPVDPLVEQEQREVYPRVGGGTNWDKGQQYWPYGLSPRGRGNPTRYSSDQLVTRSIPAWAGEPSQTLGYSRAARVYPRVGGGTYLNRAQQTAFEGLSPRGRGNHKDVSSRSLLPRSIPAWAGEPLDKRLERHGFGVYPRVGGGTGLLRIGDVAARGLSPRGRGNHLLAENVGFGAGSIPAWAGEPEV